MRPIPDPKPLSRAMSRLSTAANEVADAAEAFIHEALHHSRRSSTCKYCRRAITRGTIDGY